MKKIANWYFNSGWIPATAIAGAIGFYAGKTDNTLLIIANSVFFFVWGLAMFHFEYKR